MVEKNSRGFEQYGEVGTTYGHTVRVYESSAARGPHVWVNTRPTVTPYSDFAETTVHLDLLQAMTLRGMLDEFIEGVPERWEHGGMLLSVADKAWREANPGLVLNQRRRSCQCCAFGNHEFPCTCDGQGCCHADKHVPEHEHDFVGDSDTCVGFDGCTLTYAEHKAAQREQAMGEALKRLGEPEEPPGSPVEPSCGICGHEETRHTHTLPEEGYRAYCPECGPAVEFHEFRG